LRRNFSKSGLPYPKSTIIFWALMQPRLSTLPWVFLLSAQIYDLLTRRIQKPILRPCLKNMFRGVRNNRLKTSKSALYLYLLTL